MARYYDPNLGRWVSDDDQEAQGVGGALDMWNQGYFSDIGPLTQGQYTTGAGGQSFPDTLSYLKYLYGGNITPTDVNGETFYKVDNLNQGPQAGATPITYNSPDSMGAQLVKGGILGLAGAAAGGLLPGVEGIGGLGGFPVNEASILSGGDLGTLAQAAGEAGSTLGAGAGEFSLAGGTAGNLAGTGGLSSAAGIHGLGAGVGEAGLGLTSGAAGLSGVSGGAGGLSLLTPAITGAATGLPAAISAASTAPSAATAMGGAASAAAPATTGSALSRVWDQLNGKGEASSSDWLSILGTAGATGLGLAGANSQSNALKDVYNQQMTLGAPYRDLLTASYQPGFNLANDSAFQGALDTSAQAAARATSARSGNPVDNPGAYAEMQKYITNSTALPYLQNYRSQLGTFGQLGTNTAGAAAIGGAQANGGTYNALGYGLGQLTQPDSPFKGLLSQFGKSGFSF